MRSAVKSLADLPKLGAISTAAQEERLMSFLRACPETPAYSAMANQLGILEEGVKVILARLENKGRIHVISRQPPRIMLTENGERPYGSDVAPQREGAAGRFLDAEGERMRLGRYIADCERRGVRPPTLREMMDFVGFGEAGYVRRMAEILSERGLIQYGHGVPTKLTEQGRQLFGVRTPAKPIEAEGAKKMEQEKSVVVVPMRRLKPASRVNLLCKVLADYKRENGETSAPTFEQLGVSMGYTPKSNGAITYIVREAIASGLIAERVPRSQKPLQFTQKGLKKFMPETFRQPEPDPDFAEVDTIPIETPVVAQVAAAVSKASLAPNFNPLDFDLNSDRLRVTGATTSKAELATFIGKLGALMPFLKD